MWNLNFVQLYMYTVYTPHHTSITEMGEGAGEIRIGCSVASMHGSDTIYSARLALFLHGIMLAKRTREFRPAVLVREIICWIQASDTLHTHKSQKGSIEALNFLIIILTNVDYIIITS